MNARARRAFLVAEQPACLHLDDGALLNEWKPAYKRAMPAPPAVPRFLLGTLEAGQARDGLWLIGAIVIMLNWPWTLLVVMPINNKLMALDDVSAPDAGATRDIRTLVRTWGVCIPDQRIGCSGGGDIPEGFPVTRRLIRVADRMADPPVCDVGEMHSREGASPGTRARPSLGAASSVGKPTAALDQDNKPAQPSLVSLTEIS